MNPISKPKGRTLAEFGQLKPAEEKLLEASRQGSVAAISETCPEASRVDNTVRAAFLRFLALGGDEQAPIHESGVKLLGAWIEGKLEMDATKVPSNLTVLNCHFCIAPCFRGANIYGTLDLSGCQLPGIDGESLTCDGGLHLRNGFTATEEVSLLGAQIGGNLDCEGAKLDGKAGDALSADDAVIKGSVLLKKDFIATGQVRLVGAQIGGALDCEGAKLDGKAGYALSADCAVIKGEVFLTSVIATGEVRLPGAQIGGSLACGGAKFDGKDGYALSAGGAVIKGNVFLTSVAATGEVRLPDAQIGGSLACGGAKFDGKDGDALLADGAVIKGAAFLNKGFTATGQVRLLGAQIGDSLSCDDATFDNKVGDALSADRAVIKGSVFLNKGFTATGKVRLLGAHIGGDLECDSAKFYGKAGYALSADGMVVERGFIFRGLVNPVNGVSLAACHVGQLTDDLGSWGDGLILDGFTYGSIVGDALTDADARLAWLDKQPKNHAGLDGDGSGFKPQPWRQLAKVLREMGHAEDARQVSIAFEVRLRKSNLIGQTPKHWSKPHSWIYRNISRAGHWLFWLFTGYGYRPLRLLGWMFGVWVFFAIFYWYAALEGVFAPSSPLVFQNPEYAVCKPGFVTAVLQDKFASAVPSTVQGAGNWYLCQKLPEEYPAFSPLAYSLDVILPLVDLQQETSWSPLIPTPKHTWYQELFAICDLKHATRLLLWFENLFGWLSSILLAAVVSGLTKRREE